MRWLGPMMEIKVISRLVLKPPWNPLSLRGLGSRSAGLMDHDKAKRIQTDDCEDDHKSGMAHAGHGTP